MGRMSVNVGKIKPNAPSISNTRNRHTVVQELSSTKAIPHGLDLLRGPGTSSTPCTWVENHSSKETGEAVLQFALAALISARERREVRPDEVP